MSGTTITASAEYRPGQCVGMATHRMWLVADLDPRDPVIESCWRLVTGAASVDELLAALLEARLRPALNLAVVRLDEDRAEILVRGEAWAEVVEGSTVDPKSLEVRAGPGSFQDARVDRFDAISLHLSGELSSGTMAGSPSLPLGTGVVPASWIAIHASREGAPADRSPSGEPRSDPGIPLDDTLAADLVPDPPAPFGGRFEAMFGKTVHPTEQETVAASVPDEWTVGMHRPVGVPTCPAAGATLPPPDAFAGPPSLEDYRSPFEAPYAGSTERLPPARPAGEPTAGGNLFADVSWAAVCDVPNAGPDPYEQYHAAHPAPTSYQPPAALQVPRPAPHQLVPAGEIDPELLRTVQRAPTTPVAAGPVVPAVRCHVGHPNPPTADRCRICGGAVPPQSAEPTVRPKLGVLRLSTGGAVTLDRGVILGRAPGAPEGFGRDEPYRIQLPSPDGTLSRKHVEVVLQDWLVTVVDLHSTNGTVVGPPAGPPERLPSGGHRVIDDGWTVSLDPSTSFRYEVTE